MFFPITIMWIEFTRLLPWVVFPFKRGHILLDLCQISDFDGIHGCKFNWFLNNWLWNIIKNRKRILLPNLPGYWTPRQIYLDGKFNCGDWRFSSRKKWLCSIILLVEEKMFSTWHILNLTEYFLSRILNDSLYNIWASRNLKKMKK